ncbi:MAG: PLP-dependent transferase, partial [Roseimicrobium sp.]
RPVRNLLTDPLCRPEDLGSAVPPTPYGISVCLPLWEHVVGYEEGDQRVVEKFKSGYPRFFVPPAIAEVFTAAEKEHAKPGERALVFPRRIHAERCAAFIEKNNAGPARVAEFGDESFGVTLFPEASYKTARLFWRFCGEVLSIRQSEAALGTAHHEYTEKEGHVATGLIKQRLAEITGQNKEDIYLFPSGMAANYAVHRMLSTLLPDRKTVQLDFPYVDVLKLQERFGAGAHFLPFADDGDYDKLHALIKSEPLAGIFAELPSNPLLKCVDLRKVTEMLFLEEKDVPIIVDDTIGSNVNVDAFLIADVVTTSLTKSFSGVGDVLAGSVIINSESPWHDEFAAFLREHADHELWRGDAVALEQNSRDYVERMKTVSRNSVALYEFLAEHPAVETVYHSIADDSGLYDHLQKANGGHGCLLSFVLKDRDSAPRVYDAMQFSKGPSLGTNFTLVCPYTLLAHYDELEWAARCGVDRTLLRVSVGLEPAEVIIERMKQALEA